MSNINYMEKLERIEDKDRQEEIDDFIYEHYEEFRPYITQFEELVGPKNEAEWEEKYLEGSHGVKKLYTSTNGKLTQYTLSVGIVEDEEEFKDWIDCQIRIV